MQCPKCRLPMEQVQRHGVEVDQCASCGSTWFDPGEMTAYLKQAMSKGLTRQPVRPDVWEHGATEPVCPGCGKVRLSRGEWKRVEFRGCRGCRGVWLESKALFQLSTMGRSAPHLRLRDAPLTADDWCAGILDFVEELVVGAIQGPHV